MPADRFYGPITSILEGEELHHLRVMRIRPGETIEIVNGKGELAQALVETIDKKRAELKIISHQKQPPPDHSLILAQALPRPSALEWIIEKGTELGVTEFWLFPGERSEKKELYTNNLKNRKFDKETPQNFCLEQVTIAGRQGTSEDKNSVERATWSKSDSLGYLGKPLHRLENIAIHALKQCGRLFLPQLLLKPPLAQWQKPTGSLFFGDVTTAPKLQGPFSKTTIFFIGPEKGFSPAELNQLHLFDAKGISLHENTLRAETAAIAALCQYFSTQ